MLENLVRSARGIGLGLSFLGLSLGAVNLTGCSSTQEEDTKAQKVLDDAERFLEELRRSNLLRENLSKPVPNIDLPEEASKEEYRNLLSRLGFEEKNLDLVDEVPYTYFKQAWELDVEKDQRGSFAGSLSMFYLWQEVEIDEKFRKYIDNYNKVLGEKPRLFEAKEYFINNRDPKFIKHLRDKQGPFLQYKILDALYSNFTDDEIKELILREFSYKQIKDISSIVGDRENLKLSKSIDNLLKFAEMFAGKSKVEVEKSNDLQPLNYIDVLLKRGFSKNDLQVLLKEAQKIPSVDYIIFMKNKGLSVEDINKLLNVNTTPLRQVVIDLLEKNYNIEDIAEYMKNGTPPQETTKILLNHGYKLKEITPFVSDYVNRGRPRDDILKVCLKYGMNIDQLKVFFDDFFKAQVSEKREGGMLSSSGLEDLTNSIANRLMTNAGPNLKKSLTRMLSHKIDGEFFEQVLSTGITPKEFKEYLSWDSEGTGSQFLGSDYRTFKLLKDNNISKKRFTTFTKILKDRKVLMPGLIHENRYNYFKESFELGFNFGDLLYFMTSGSSFMPVPVDIEYIKELVGVGVNDANDICILSNVSLDLKKLPPNWIKMYMDGNFEALYSVQERVPAAFVQECRQFDIGISAQDMLYAHIAGVLPSPVNSQKYVQLKSIGASLGSLELLDQGLNLEILRKVHDTFGIKYFERYDKETIEKLNNIIDGNQDLSNSQLVFMFNAYDDWNGIGLKSASHKTLQAHLDDAYSLQQEGSKKLIMIPYEGNSDKGLVKAAKDFVRRFDTKILDASIFGHGNASSMDIGNGNGDQYELDKGDIEEYKAMKELFKQNGKIYLLSCSTGAEEEGLAQVIADNIGVEVVGPKVPVGIKKAIADYSSDIPRVSFEYIAPLEEHPSKTFKPRDK